MRAPIPAAPGQIQRYDFEYRRNGTVNLFVSLDAHHPWRHVKGTDRRRQATSPNACATLSTCTSPRPAASASCRTTALYQAFPPAEARRFLRRLEFHHTPKHAKWLNMAEIEIGVLRKRCLARRIDNRQLMEPEIAAWQRQRNASAAHINWMFSSEPARIKMGRAYPTLEVKESKSLCRATRRAPPNPRSSAAPFRPRPDHGKDVC